MIRVTFHHLKRILSVTTTLSQELLDLPPIHFMLQMRLYVPHYPSRCLGPLPITVCVYALAAPLYLPPSMLFHHLKITPLMTLTSLKNCPTSHPLTSYYKCSLTFPTTPRCFCPLPITVCIYAFAALPYLPPSMLFQPRQRSSLSRLSLRAMITAITQGPA